jgi:hypothetical protein
MRSKFIRITATVIVLAAHSRCPAKPRRARPARFNRSIQMVTRFEKNLLALAEAMPADKFNFAPNR